MNSNLNVWKTNAGVLATVSADTLDLRLNLGKNRTRELISNYSNPKISFLNFTRERGMSKAPWCSKMSNRLLKMDMSSSINQIIIMNITRRMIHNHFMCWEPRTRCHEAILSLKAQDIARYRSCHSTLISSNYQTTQMLKSFLSKTSRLCSLATQTPSAFCKIFTKTKWRN